VVYFPILVGEFKSIGPHTPDVLAEGSFVYLAKGYMSSSWIGKDGKAYSAWTLKVVEGPMTHEQALEKAKRESAELKA